MRATGSGKGLLDAVGLKQLCERTRCVLLSSVAMKGQIFRFAALLIRIPKCRGDQVGAGITGYSVADNLA